MRIMHDLRRTAPASNITVRDATTGKVIRMETPNGKPIPNKQRARVITKKENKA